MHYEENQATAKLCQIFVFENVYIQRKPETQIEKDIYIPLFKATFTIAQIWKQPKRPPTSFPGGTSGKSPARLHRRHRSGLGSVPG